AVLTDLKVQWGRGTIVDQPSPSTCTLTLADALGGKGFLADVGLGYALQVRADALIYPDPDEPGSSLVMSHDMSTLPPVVVENAAMWLDAGRMYLWNVNHAYGSRATFPAG